MTKKMLSLLLCLLLTLGLFAGCQEKNAGEASRGEEDPDETVTVTLSTADDDAAEASAAQTDPVPTDPEPTQSASSVTKPDNGLDAEAILAEARTSMESLDSYAVSCDLPAKLKQVSYGVAITVTCSFSLEMEVVLPDRAIHMTFSMDMGRFGGKESMEVFAFEEDGVMTYYSRSQGEDVFVRTQAEAGEELLPQGDILGRLDLDWTAEETADAYELTAVLDPEQTKQLLGSSVLIIGETDAQGLLADAELDPITVVMTIEKETNRVTGVTADVTTLLDTLLRVSDSGMTASSAVLTVTLSRFNEIDPITPPEDYTEGSEPPV